MTLMFLFVFVCNRMSADGRGASYPNIFKSAELSVFEKLSFVHPVSAEHRRRVGHNSDRSRRLHGLVTTHDNELDYLFNAVVV